MPEVKGGDPAPLLSTGEATPEVLGPVLGTMGETWTCWRVSSEGP